MENFNKFVEVMLKMNDKSMVKVATKLARLNPEMFISLAEENDYVGTVIDVINEQRLREPHASGKIPAIHAVRKAAPKGSMSLSEMKKLVEDIMEDYKDVILAQAPHNVEDDGPEPELFGVTGIDTDTNTHD